MDWNKLNNYFEEIKKAKGNSKKPLILKALKDPHFIKVLTYILHPTKKYNISKLKRMSTASSNTDLFNFLDYLSSKNGSSDQDKENLTLIASESEAKFTLVNKILRKKTDAGFTNKTINKLCPGLIPYFPYMRCKGVAHLHKIKFPCISQLKADGMYVESEGGGFRTRNGNKLDFSNVFNPPSHEGTIMGECLLLKPGSSTEFMGRREGNALINKAQEGPLPQEIANRVRFKFWDIIDSYSKRLGYSVRFSHLKSITYDVIESRIVNNIDEAWNHYEEVRARGLEGTILKNLEGKWKDGNSHDQIKLKALLECELEVYDFVPGEDKNEGLIGSLCCQSSDGGVVTDVGMGLSDEDRRIDPEDWNGKIVSVVFNEVSRSKNKDTYALSHARMVEPRRDKTEADSTEYILELKEAKRN